MLAVWLLVQALGGGHLAAEAQAPGYLHTEGSKIVDSAGREVILTGINWFGLETPNFAPHGLWARNWESILDQISELGFNTIRLPYSNQLFDPGNVPNGINYDLNPDLQGLSGLEVMDVIIEGAGARGIKVMLDRHRPDCYSQSELWYTAQYSEERWIGDWVMLAGRYAGNDTVIAADLHNEPHGGATWGTGNAATDWRLAAERAGNAILAANPNLLIVVQGVDQYQGDWYWWGGNLMGVRDHPVRLDVPGRLVYSTHVYGAGVYPQPWFWDPAFPGNLPGIWDSHWGYLDREGIAPLIVGEFGGRSVGDDKEGVWQRTLVEYLREHSLSYFYWTLNPNSGDTGGLLLDDWESVDPAKLALLSGYQFPLLGIEELGGEGSVWTGSGGGTPPPGPTATPGPAEPSPTLAPVAPGTLRVRYRAIDTSAWSKDSKPEFVIVNAGSSPVALSRVELFYWFSDDSGQPFVFHCDWAAVSCASIVGDISGGGSTQYLRLSFRPGAGSVLAGQDSGEIKLRFNRADWSEHLQTDDYSFGANTAYAEWERVTLCVDGFLVWGIEPAPVCRAVPPTSVPTATPVETPTVQAAPSPSTAVETATGTPVAEASTKQMFIDGPSTEAVTGEAPGPAGGSSPWALLGCGAAAGLAVGAGGVALALGLLAALGRYWRAKE